MLKHFIANSKNKHACKSLQHPIHCIQCLSTKYAVSRTVPSWQFWPNVFLNTLQCHIFEPEATHQQDLFCHPVRPSGYCCYLKLVLKRNTLFRVVESGNPFNIQQPIQQHFLFWFGLTWQKPHVILKKSFFPGSYGR